MSNKDMMKRQICLARAIMGLVQVDDFLFLFVLQVGVIQPCCVSHLTATGHLDNQC